MYMSLAQKLKNSREIVLLNVERCYRNGYFNEY